MKNNLIEKEQMKIKNRNISGTSPFFSFTGK